MEKLEVLWLDDDSPEEVKLSKDVNVITAQTCAEAEGLLKSGKAKPKWVIVDLIVPQGNWGQPAQKMPGLKYIEHLRREYGKELGIVAYSIVMPPELENEAVRAGATRAVAKSTTSLTDVIKAFSV